MAMQQRTTERDNGRTQPTIATPAEPHVGDLLKQLGAEGAALVRSELTLAKLELSDMAREIALDAAKLFGTIAFVLTGVLALLAAAVIALGDALDGGYALAALIIGIVTFMVGILFARSGLDGLKRGRKPGETVASLKETRVWASDEVREFKNEMRA
jgi:uncharacterized membrane protein YqjE